MAIQFSSTVRNQMLDAIEVAVSASAVLKIRTGSAPSSVGGADSGTVLASLQLPSDWMAAAASGAKALSGTWEDASANTAGTAGHFRIYNVDTSTAHIQGSITSTGGGGDMIIQNTSITTGQDITVTSFTLTAGNA